MGRGKGAESGRVQAGNTAPWARSSLLRGTHPTAGAAQETQPAVGPHTVQFFDEQAVGTESARVDLPGDRLLQRRVPAGALETAQDGVQGDDQEVANRDRVDAWAWRR